MANVLHPEPDDLYFQATKGEASASLLKDFRRSPGHYLWTVEKPRGEPTPSMRFGTAVHCAILEPLRFHEDYAVEPDFGDLRTKAAREAKAAWAEEYHEGKLFLSREDMHRAFSVQSAVRAAKVFVPENCRTEQVARWTDVHEVPCKAKIDAYDQKTGTLWDLKTSRDASPEGMRRAIWSYSYQYQLAFYRRALEQIGLPCKRVVLLAVETSAPFGVGAYELSLEELDHFEGEILGDLERLAECTRSDTWPSYTDGIQPLSLYRAQRQPEDDYDIEEE